MSACIPLRLPEPAIRLRAVSAAEAAEIPPERVDRSGRFRFRVPRHWQTSIERSPFAERAQGAVLEWLARLGCTDAELRRAARFDIAGYVGTPFPLLPEESTVRVARYLSLWLLWDDVQVESLGGRWRIDADHLLADTRPEGMTRFDEGWWQLLAELRDRRSAAFLHRICRAMAAWDLAAADEAQAVMAWVESGALPDLEKQLELRIATIGMYATLYLLEDAYDYELPVAFHAHPAVRELKKLANEIVGLGNDVLSCGKDLAEGKINLVTSLIAQHGLPGDEALERIVRLHDSAIEEFDRVAAPIARNSPHHGHVIRRWIEDVRYASVGFGLWEAQAPRYTAHRLVAGDRLVELGFDFVPASAKAERRAAL